MQKQENLSPDERFSDWQLDLGACKSNDGRTTFRVWAPHARKVQLLLLKEDGEWVSEMDEQNNGYFVKTLEVGEKAKYFYLLDQTKKRADPASRFQPDGVDGPSQVIDGTAFEWTDRAWKGLEMERLIIYELHVGTFTQEGTFESIIPRLDYLVEEVGITAIELMPVSQFPGERNWGYDGVFMFSPQNSYGGVTSLKRLIDVCHSKGLAVIMDVVYNHLGPEGNYLQDFGPYFSYKYKTPWGPSINYDDRGCDEVRKYIVSNALYWITDYHIDGLRLDAIHGIFDFSPKHILEEIKEATTSKAKALNRRVNIIAESDLNDPKVIRSKLNCGYGLDAQWSDDFHHSVHSYLTHERFGYYQDFGSLDDITKAMTCGFVFDGKYSVFRGRTHGATSKDLPGRQFVISLQNHDQVGNRPDGLRLGRLINTSALKVAVGLLVLSPNVPLLFMGEEYGEEAPFYYFTSHTDAQLVNAVREGRKKEFESHGWSEQYLDPQDYQTFRKSKLNYDLRDKTINSELLTYYHELITMRKNHAALRSLDKENMLVRQFPDQETLVIRRGTFGTEELAIVCTLGGKISMLTDIVDRGRWKRIFDSNSVSQSIISNSVPEEISAGANTFSFPPFTLAVYSHIGT